MFTLTKKQREIVDIAIFLISQGGIQNLTMRNISHQLGNVESAIYKHFDSKTSILCAILDNFKSNLEQIVKELEKKELSPMQKLESFFVLRAQEFTDNPHTAKVIFSEEIFQNDEVLTRKVKEVMHFNHEIFSQMVIQAQQAGQIRQDLPQDQIITMILGSFRLTVTKWRMGGFKSNLVKECSDLMDTFKKIFTE